MVLCGVLFAGWAGYRLFERWEQRHLLRKAHALLDQGDLRGAYLNARQAFAKRPRDAVACSVLIEVAEKSRSPEEMFWRVRLTEIEPTLEHKLQWAAAALKFGMPEIADQALLTVSPRDQQGAEYHQMAAALAASLHQNEQALHHFSEVVRLKPGDEVALLNLAAAQLSSSSPEHRKDGRERLFELLKNPSLEETAMRALAGDALLRGDGGEALKLAKELVIRKEAGFQDRLLQLDVQLKFDRTLATDLLGRLQTEASGNPAATYALMSHLHHAGMARESLAFFESLPLTVARTQPVPLAAADACVLAGDWKKLQSLVEEGNWGVFDFLRQAFVARAYREQRQMSRAEIPWRLSMSEASHRADTLSMLAHLTDSWGWDVEAEKLWRTLVESRVRDRAALQALYRIYQKRGDSHGLLEVMNGVVERSPHDLVAVNNRAQLLLLLESTDAIQDAVAVAKSLYDRDPLNPVFASTHAFAMYRLGRSEEARRVLENLKSTDLQTPAIAAYYGIVLASVQQDEMARRYLKLAERAVLLPEEKQRVMEARRALDGREMPHATR